MADELGVLSGSREYEDAKSVYKRAASKRGKSAGTLPNSVHNVVTAQYQLLARETKYYCLQRDTHSCHERVRMQCLSLICCENGTENAFETGVCGCAFGKKE